MSGGGGSGGGETENPSSLLWRMAQIAVATMRWDMRYKVPVLIVRHYFSLILAKRRCCVPQRCLFVATRNMSCKINTPTFNAIPPEITHKIKSLQKSIHEENSVDYENLLGAMERVDDTNKRYPYFTEARLLFASLLSKVSSLDGNMSCAALYRFYLIVKNCPADTDLHQTFLDKFEAHSDTCSDHLGDMVAGVNGVNFNDDHRSRFLKCVHVKLLAMQNRGLVLSSDQLGRLFYGLRDHSSGDDQVQCIMRSLVHHVRNFRDTDQVDDEFIRHMFTGLHKKSSDVKVVRVFVEALADLIRRRTLTHSETPQRLSATSIRHMLRGMADLSSQSRQVQLMVGVVAELLPLVQGTMSPTMIGDSLLGLKDMVLHENHQVVSILRRLCEYMENTTVPFDAGSVSAVMMGLHSMSDDSVVVRRTLSVLAAKIKHAPTPIAFTLKQISVCLGGMEGMRTNHRPEVRELLLVMVERLTAIRESGITEGCAGDPKLLAIMLTGLCAVGTKFKEVGRAVEDVLDWVSGAGLLYSKDVKSLAFAARSLVHPVLDGHAASMQFTARCLQEIESTLKGHDAQPLEESTSLLLWQVTCFLSMSKHVNDEYRNRLMGLQDLLRPRIDQLSALLPKPHERKIAQNIKQIIDIRSVDKSRIEVLENTYYCGFSTDIILRMSDNNGQAYALHNIELDGMYHLRAKKRVWNKLRDCYLTERLGMKVFRVPIYKSVDFKLVIGKYVGQVISSSK